MCVEGAQGFLPNPRALVTASAQYSAHVDSFAQLVTLFYEVLAVAEQRNEGGCWVNVVDITAEI